MNSDSEFTSTVACERVHGRSISYIRFIIIFLFLGSIDRVDNSSFLNKKLRHLALILREKPIYIQAVILTTMVNTVPCVFQTLPVFCNHSNLET